MKFNRANPTNRHLLLLVRYCLHFKDMESNAGSAPTIGRFTASPSQVVLWKNSLANDKGLKLYCIREALHGALQAILRD